MNLYLKLLFFATLFFSQNLFAEDCGIQAGGKMCPNSLCCSQYGFCGVGSDYCCVYNTPGGVRGCQVGYGGVCYGCSSPKFYFFEAIFETANNFCERPPASLKNKGKVV